MSVITGSSNSSAGPALTILNGQDVEETFLVEGKSKLEVTIRDERALIARTESSIWSGGQWRLVGWTNYGYDIAGRLLVRTASNGAVYSATYDGGLKASETDENGVISIFAYDPAGRRQTATRQGSGAIGTVVTRYSLDAADQTLEQRVGWGQTEQRVSTWQYDDAGRLTAETPPGLGSTIHSYDVANRTHTIAHPDGGTTVLKDYLDGRWQSKTGTAVVAEYNDYGVETSGSVAGFQWERTLIGSSPLSPRWTKKTFDWLGRERKNEHPGFAGGANYVEEKFYDGTDAVGNLWKATRPAAAATLYQYNAMGQLWRSGLDVNGNGVLDLASSDRITEAETYLESYNGAYWLRTDKRGYPYSNSSTPVTTSTARTRLTGHPANRQSEVQSVDAEGVITTETVDVNRDARTAEKTQTRAGLSGSAVTNFVNGFPTTSTTYDGLITTTGYDSLLRSNATTDSRGNITSTVFVSGTMRPSTIIDDSGAQTIFGYDNMGRVLWKRDQRNHYSRFSYNLRGQIVREWGDGTVPVEYGYDSTYGDRVSMSTFRGGTGWEGTSWPTNPGTADTTTWTYDAGSGLLTGKTDALNRTVSQSYCGCGRVESRTLARGVTIVYGYDSATGEMTSVVYSDGTPSVTYSYTRLGQIASVADATGTRTLSYDPAKPWRLSGENSSSYYNNRVLTRLYETTGMPGRIRGFQLGPSSGSNADLEQTFGYTAAGRFETLTSGRNANAALRTFRYGYEPSSALLKTLAIDVNHPFTVMRTYDPNRDLVTSIETKWSTTTRSKYDFTYDERRNRTTLVQSGDVFSDYGNATHRIFEYDGRGQLLTDAWFLGSNPTDQTQPLPGRRHEYAYENAGNRLWANHTGVSDAREDYTHNALNQVVSKESNSQASTGTTEPANAVTVDGAAAGRQDRFYSGEVLPPSSANASLYNFLVAITPPGQSTTTEARTLLARASLQSLAYDLDGNMSTDGVWDYTWDGENRLVRMNTTPFAAANGVPNREITFNYDYLGRRVQKRVVDLNGSGGIWTGTNIAITNGSHNEGPPFTVTAAGSDIWGTSDEFRFVHQQMTGDGTALATVTALNNTDTWAKAGLMIRESLAADARNAFVHVTPSNNSGFQYRSSAGGSTASAPGAPYTWMPARLKLVRTGNTITGSISQDGGTTWTEVGSATLSGLPSTVYVGLAVTSHNASTATTATFENISVPASGGATETSSRRYLYDGWNLIAEFNAPGGTTIGSLVRSYTWGLDIVHSLTLAGGVGALLQIADHASGKTYLPAYDGNGNVASLINADTGAAAAAYEYSPFGEPLRAQTIDATVADQPFRFSTRFVDLETGLVYYGRRYYDPRLGRFVCRDPKEELGGINLYGFVGNNSINRWDYLGMCEGEESESNLDYLGEDNEDDGGALAFAEAVNQDAIASAGMSSTPDPTKNGQVPSNNARNTPAFGPAAPSGPQAQPGSFEVFAGIDADAVGIVGVEGNVGVVLNLNNLSQSGVYFGAGPAAGANVGGAIQVGYARRGVEGDAFNIDANVGKVSPTASFDNDGFNGVAVGYGPGAGLSVSATKTGKYTVAEVAKDVKRACQWIINKVTGGD